RRGVLRSRSSPADRRDRVRRRHHLREGRRGRRLSVREGAAPARRAAMSSGTKKFVLHVISADEYAVMTEPLEIKSAIRSWMTSLVENRLKNAYTLCPSCRETVNDDVGGFMVFQPVRPWIMGVIVCLCRKCFASKRSREEIIRWVEATARRAEDET